MQLQLDTQEDSGKIDILRQSRMIRKVMKLIRVCIVGLFLTKVCSIVNVLFFYFFYFMLMAYQHLPYNNHSSVFDQVSVSKMWCKYLF